MMDRSAWISVLLFAAWYLLAADIFPVAMAWDAEELELFDLVEDVNQNFYELLELSQTATPVEIRKAYRQLSLRYHPDKNKESNAEEMFRKIVAVAEVLRDEEKRKRYDQILQNGLPDWRQPVYYYRRVRKMGLWEMAAFLFALITVGQHLVAWSVYWERKYELEEMFMSKIRKKEKKSKKGKSAALNVDTYLSEHLSQLPKPRYQDLLVVRLATFLVYLVRSAPSFYQRFREVGQFWRTQNLEPVDFEDEKECTHKPRKRAKPEFPDYSCIFPAVEAPSSESEDASSNVKEEMENCAPTREGLPWTEADYVLLQKAMTKFPVGCTQRWEKVAAMMNRSVSEVTITVKQVKSVIGGHVPPSLQGITGASGENKVELPPVETRRDELEAKTKPANPTKPCKKSVERTLAISQQIPAPPKAPSSLSGTEGNVKKLAVTTAPCEKNNLDETWSQQQQRALELALQQFPKGTEDRWERIAKCVPGKTKEACMMRFKIIAELVRRKKTSQQLAS